MVIWLNVNSQTKKFNIKINVGSGLPEYAGKSVKDIEQMLQQTSALIDDFWLIKFNPLTTIQDLRNAGKLLPPEILQIYN